MILNQVERKLTEAGYKVEKTFSAQTLFGETCLAVQIKNVSEIFEIGALLADQVAEITPAQIDQQANKCVLFFPKLKTSFEQNLKLTEKAY